MAPQALQGVQETLDGSLAWLETKCQSQEYRRSWRAEWMAAASWKVHLQEPRDLVVARRQLGEAVWQDLACSRVLRRVAWRIAMPFSVFVAELGLELELEVEWERRRKSRRKNCGC
jgi:hypothetical protein